MRREVWEQIRRLPDLLTTDMVMHMCAVVLGWAFSCVRPLAS